MSSMVECENRLRTLQQYIPFLERMIERLATSEDDSQCRSMKNLLAVISNSGKQLKPETLDRCEEVLKNMYHTFEGEDTHYQRVSGKSGWHSDLRPTQANQPYNRYITTENDLSAVEETPRSPSPEETNRVSSSFIPKSIPVADARRQSDNRNHSSSSRESLGLGNLRPVKTESQHLLRTEPVEIPLRSRTDHVQSLDSEPKAHYQDRDYRQSFDNKLDDWRVKETRVVGYQNSDKLMTDHSPVAGTSNRFNESRFDIYGRNRNSGQWNDQPKRGDSYSYADERDRYVQRNTIDHSSGMPERIIRYHGDTPSSFQGNPNSRSSLPHWQSDPYPPAHHNPQASSHHNPQASSHHNPQASSHHNSHRMPENCWNNYPGNQSLPDRNFFPSYPRQDRHVLPNQGPSNPYATGGAGPPGSSVPPRMPSQCNPSKPSPLPDPFSASSRNSYSGASSQSSGVSGYHQQPSSYLNQKAASNSKPQVIPPARREDPRLANRSKKFAHPPQETRTNSYQSHQSHQSNSAANVTPNSKVTEPSESEAHDSRSSENFVSPLGSLYSSSSKTGQTGRGYGVQNYKIPKKKVEPKRTDVPIEDAVTSVTPSDEPTKEVSTEKEPAAANELPAIDRNVLESYIKKALPSDDAAKLLEKMREMEQSGETAEKEETSSNPTESNALHAVSRPNERVDSPVVDATVTSSGDSLIINEDADELETSNVQEPVSDIQEPASSAQEPPSNIQEKQPPKKRGRRKKSSTAMSEVVRLQEDVTDFMKNVGDLQGKRRNRSRVQICTETISGDDMSENMSLNDSEAEKERSLTQTPTKRSAAKNKNKSPIADNESKDADAMDDESFDWSSSESAEPSESANRAKRKKSAATPSTSPVKKKPGRPRTCKVNSKKKKTFTPTRLSLRGRRSMYENTELSDQPVLEQPPNAGSNDQYYQCKECSYLGQQVVHHYVNEHNGIEIPFVLFPGEEWDSLVNRGPASDTFNHPMNKDMLRDLSWIPSRPNYVSPITCKFCPYSASKRSELLEHVMLHALPSDFKYRCSLCGLVESNFFDMYDHIASHTGEYRYQCNYCRFRVAKRNCIKQHMSSLHKSQDELFYDTILLDSDRLWIYGYVCLTCRFVQMNEDHLERHLIFSPTCQEHMKIDLATVILDSNLPSDGNILNKEMAIFVCSSIQDDGCGDQPTGDLAQNLKTRFIPSIKMLAEKMTQQVTAPDQTEPVPVPVSASVADPVCNPVLDSVSDPAPAPAPIIVPTPILVPILTPVSVPVDPVDPINPVNPADPVDPVDESQPATNSDKLNKSFCSEHDMPSLIKIQRSPEKQSDEEEGRSKDDTVFGTNLLERWKNQNSFLDDIISKLTDKLPSVEAAPLVATDDESEEESEDNSEEESDEESSLASAEVSVRNEDSPEPPCLMEVEASDEPGFLRIENVISLNPSESDPTDDSLDPIQSVVTFSSVTIRKDECFFPYSAPHNRFQLAIQLKNALIYQKMVERQRIKSLYKCMAFRCMYSSDSDQDFNRHIHWHYNDFLVPRADQIIPQHTLFDGNNDRETLTIPDFYLCSYCPNGAVNSEDLLQHINAHHGHCLFQCSTCFFRAKSAEIVEIHVTMDHSSSHSTGAQVLECRSVALSSQSQPEQFTIQHIPRYRCSIKDCAFSCVHESSFVQHLSDSHDRIKSYGCPQCPLEISVDAATSDFNELLKHLNTHGIGLFQCSLCLWASQQPSDIFLHMCLSHPSFHESILLRRSRSVSQSAVQTMADFWTPLLHQASSSSLVQKIDFTRRRFKDMLSRLKVVESCLQPDEDIKFDSDVELIDISMVGDSSAAKDSGLSEPIQTSDSGNKPSDKEGEAEFYGFGEEEQAKAKEQSECIVIESDLEDDASPDASPADLQSVSQPPTEDYKCTEQEEEELDGLIGRELYLCGNIGCDETTETAVALKEHLLMCDLARDSRLLTCRHCGKTSKHVTHLLEHLRLHGVKRFSCGLCNYRACQSTLVRKHMKTTHRVGIVDDVPMGSGPINSEFSQFILYPREMVKKFISAKSRTSNQGSDGRGAKSKPKSYSCQDACNIPMKSIFPFSIRCDHCGYTSKVRSNMIYHLSLHERHTDGSNGTSSEGEEIIPRIIIPHQAPINPVPHLEGKEKMFDKMTNLANSSHSDGNTNSRMGGTATAKNSGTDELSTPPVFIPDHQRYVCGFTECSHLTINETMLKYHLQTLHKNAVFSCPHCPPERNDAADLSIELFKIHLRMHGPRLHRCGHCFFYHWHLQEVEHHLNEKHPNRPPWQIIVREPDDPDVKRRQNTSKSNPVEMPWHCSMCKQVTVSCPDMMSHVEAFHGVKNRFKCALCPVRCNIRSEFDRHFASRHPGDDVKVLSMFYRVEKEEQAGSSDGDTAEAVVVQPLWKKNESRQRHIRGHLLEEETKFQKLPVAEQELPVQCVKTAHPVYGPYGTPSDGMLCCPLCKNYRVSYSRDFKFHLYRELKYKKFLCSLCTVGGSSRLQVSKHVEKQHPKEHAYIREIASDPSLEDWVEKVIKIQSAILKKSKLSVPTKAKKGGAIEEAASASSASSASSAAFAASAASAASTASTASPTPLPQVSLPKAKKSFPSTPSSSPIKLEAASLHPEVILLDDSPPVTKANFTCPLCPFTTASANYYKKHEILHQTKSANFMKNVKPSLKSDTVASEETQSELDTNMLPDVISSEGNAAGLVKKAMKVAAPTPYHCKYCKFRCVSENGINIHWKRRHSLEHLLDFECEPHLIKSDAFKIYYQCQYCQLRETFLDIKEHSRLVHPDVPMKVCRCTVALARVRNRAETSEAVSLEEPPAKTTRTEDESSTSSLKAQTVFVVAPPPPTFSCVWCNSTFQTEEEVIHHHSDHPNNVPLRYTRATVQPSPVEALNTSESEGRSNMSRSTVEIRFGCPVCQKYFVSMSAAQSHVSEHKQAWKCGHCVMLFGSPALALQHWKEIHPDLQGLLESIDSPSMVVEKLSKGITINRLELNAKSQSKEKQIELTDRTDAMMHAASSESASPPVAPMRVSAVARKSTSNMFLRETMKEVKPEVQSIDTAAGCNQQSEVKLTKTTTSSINLPRGSSLMTAESSLISPLIPIINVEDCSIENPTE